MRILLFGSGHTSSFKDQHRLSETYTEEISSDRKCIESIMHYLSKVFPYTPRNRRLSREGRLVEYRTRGGNDAEALVVRE